MLLIQLLLENMEPIRLSLQFNHSMILITSSASWSVILPCSFLVCKTPSWCMAHRSLQTPHSRNDPDIPRNGRISLLLSAHSQKSVSIGFTPTLLLRIIRIGTKVTSSRPYLNSTISLHAPHLSRICFHPLLLHSVGV